MFALIYFTCFFAYGSCVHLANRRAANRVALTNHVFPLAAVHHTTPEIPSSKHLYKRRPLSPASHPANSSGSDPETLGPTQQDILTVGGRVYMTNISLGDREYKVVIDTGSSDTWVASSTFKCLAGISAIAVPNSVCGFGTLYDRYNSTTYQSIPGWKFGVRYTDGENLNGEMGVELLGIGGGASTGGHNSQKLTVNQTIGVVESGYWAGDGVSSGLMGLAYPALATHSQVLNYSSVIFNLFEKTPALHIFSLALSRPTIDHPAAGGLLAIGGIPDIAHDPEWVSVPITAVVEDQYTFYSVAVDGFDVTPPSLNQSSASVSSSSTAAATVTAVAPLFSIPRSLSLQQKLGSVVPGLISTVGVSVSLPVIGVQSSTAVVLNTSSHSIFPQSSKSSLGFGKSKRPSSTKKITELSSTTKTTKPTLTTTTNQKTAKATLTTTTTRRMTTTVTRRNTTTVTIPKPTLRPSSKANKARQIPQPENSDPAPTTISTPGLSMVVDSGCTLMYVPDRIADEIASLFVPRAIYAPNKNTYLVPCSAAAPRVGIIIGGRSFYMHEDDLMNKSPGAVGGGGVTVKGSSSSSESGVITVDASGNVQKEGRLCTLALQRTQGGDAVLGDSWLKNVLAVFDIGDSKMRFAARENY